MNVCVSGTKDLCGRLAAEHGAVLIQDAIQTRGECNVILATGASQFEMLSHLVSLKSLDWSKVTCFHLDEYIGLTDDHPASFVKYLKERFVNKIDIPVKHFHYVQGTPADGATECSRLNKILNKTEIDVAFIGIGENSHIAFNDPPADFETVEPYIVVNLDEACRKQQLGEGWFKSLDEVPQQAISMSVQQIMKSKALVVTVPDKRKAAAVQTSIEGPLQPSVPASILQRHNNCVIFLDKESASLLSK
ncbi:glucosamine-6-phosphate deaminase-like [Corticium candelabrum]|uniref:glucosamine-6-phosphate deaminase-like n=1 Tax=Corticium candelabrum TaxID=121492 RepID=UPI002E256B42|nr:glucosamine-6-phosphate deaminase-like [Corticium candelabrum]